MQIPKRMYGRIARRHGLALKHLINIGGGVIDSGFRGKVCIILFNHSFKAFQVDI